jgi:16S rRNA (cytosine967-C5)-methyltransferase
VRRHPEIPWNRSKEQLKKLVELQSRLLKNAWDLLKIDGTLIYSVCSIFSEEGDKQITKFLENNSDAKKIQSSLIKPSLSSNSCLTEIEENYLGSDGFFYGKLRKINI